MWGPEAKLPHESPKPEKRAPGAYKHSPSQAHHLWGVLVRQVSFFFFLLFPTYACFCPPPPPPPNYLPPRTQGQNGLYTYTRAYVYAPAHADATHARRRACACATRARRIKHVLVSSSFRGRNSASQTKACAFAKGRVGTQRGVGISRGVVRIIPSVILQGHRAKGGRHNGIVYKISYAVTLGFSGHYFYKPREAVR